MTINDTIDEASLLASALSNVSLDTQKPEAIDNMLTNLIQVKEKHLKVCKKKKICKKKTQQNIQHNKK